MLTLFGACAVTAMMVFGSVLGIVSLRISCRHVAVRRGRGRLGYRRTLPFSWSGFPVVTPGVILAVIEWTEHGSFFHDRLRRRRL
jgi:hypothetical protein